jgi:hypothetical protein
MQEIPHGWFDIGALSAVVTLTVASCSLAWKAIQRINRDESLRQDFPPHRHINGKILYPHEYKPAAVEHLPGAH